MRCCGCPTRTEVLALECPTKGELPVGLLAESATVEPVRDPLSAASKWASSFVAPRVDGAGRPSCGAGEHASEVVGAGRHVLHRPLVRRLLDEDGVLFEVYQPS